MCTVSCESQDLPVRANKLFPSFSLMQALKPDLLQPKRAPGGGVQVLEQHIHDGVVSAMAGQLLDGFEQGRPAVWVLRLAVLRQQKQLPAATGPIVAPIAAAVLRLHACGSMGSLLDHHERSSVSPSPGGEKSKGLRALATASTDAAVRMIPSAASHLAPTHQTART